MKNELAELDHCVETALLKQPNVPQRNLRFEASEGRARLAMRYQDDGVPLGMCGLLKRDTLRDVDVGFAFLPEFWGHGYAFEAASAVLSYGKEVLGLGRIVAITSPDNDGSIRVLTKLGMQFEGMIQLTDSEPEVRLFA